MQFTGDVNKSELEIVTENQTGLIMHFKNNSLIPELSVKDLDKSLRFYTYILEFKLEYKREVGEFAFLSFGTAQLMIEQVNETWKTGELQYPFGRGINFQFKVEDSMQMLSRLKKHNYPEFVPMEENWYRVKDRLWGSREFLVLDPDGYLLRFSQDLGFKDISD